MTYTLTAEDFEAAVRREFDFLSEAGFAGPVFSVGDGRLDARFAAPDLAIRVTCFLEDDAPVTSLTRPRLGRRLDLETLHALNQGDDRYPPATGLPSASQAEFEERLGLAARLLGENLAAARERDELYEEAGGRV